MEPLYIDLNCDMGESYGRFQVGNDAAVFPFISSCNIACGFHGGDPQTIDRAIRLAVDYDARIGAHPSFPDLMGFGRRTMDIEAGELRSILLYQIAALKGMTESCGGRLAYVKPHGALYNLAAKDETVCDTLLKAMRSIDPSLQLMGLAGSRMQKAATAMGVGFIAEAFADRRYEADGQLRSRRLSQAVLHDPKAVSEQVLSIIRDKCVYSLDGQAVRIEAQSICVHGDTPNAVELLRTLNLALREADIIRKAPDS